MIFSRSMRPAIGLSAAVVMGAMVAVIGAQAQQPPAAQPPAPTPKNQWGVTDFSGLWVGGVGGAGPTGEGGGSNFQGRGGDFEGFYDSALIRMNDPNKPLYRPEFWQEVKENDYYGNWRDPTMSCLPAGVPRQGPPSAIYQTEKEVVLVYGWAPFALGAFNTVRIVPIDGRPHNAAQVANESWSGSSIGRIEGNKLTIETIGLSPRSWLHKSGYIHGYNTKVVETITREGNRFTWQATVHDDEYLLKPWTMNPVVRTLNTDPTRILGEGGPCEDKDVELITSPTRSGAL
jgi:hypothetical protein